MVAVAGAGDVVTRGLWHVLGQAPDLEVMQEYPLRFPHVGALPDVVLYDAVAIRRDEGAELTALIDARETAVVVVGRELRPDLALRPCARRATGYVSLEASACEILSVVREAACARAAGRAGPDHPPALGGEVHLTVREAMVLGDIVQGFANVEIAERQCISVNTIKTCVRSAYRKIGVTTRAQAVSWGLQHGFPPGGTELRQHATSDRSMPSMQAGPPSPGREIFTR